MPVMPTEALEAMARKIEATYGGYRPEACTLHAAATLADALDRNTAALKEIDETLQLLRGDLLYSKGA